MNTNTYRTTYFSCLQTAVYIKKIENTGKIQKDKKCPCCWSTYRICCCQWSIIQTSPEISYHTHNFIIWVCSINILGKKATEFLIYFSSWNGLTSAYSAFIYKKKYTLTEIFFFFSPKCQKCLKCKFNTFFHSDVANLPITKQKNYMLSTSCFWLACNRKYFSIEDSLTVYSRKRNYSWLCQNLHTKERPPNTTQHQIAYTVNAS